MRDGRERERDLYYRRVAGMRNDTTLEDEIEQDTSLVGTPDDMIAALAPAAGGRPAGSAGSWCWPTTGRRARPRCAATS